MSPEQAVNLLVLQGSQLLKSDIINIVCLMGLKVITTPNKAAGGALDLHLFL
jgi:hypothetical protein